MNVIHGISPQLSARLEQASPQEMQSIAARILAWAFVQAKVTEPEALEALTKFRDGEAVPTLLRDHVAELAQEADDRYLATIGPDDEPDQYTAESYTWFRKNCAFEAMRDACDGKFASAIYTASTAGDIRPLDAMAAAIVGV